MRRGLASFPAPIAAAVAASLLAAPVAFGASCESLGALTLPDTTITVAQPANPPPDFTIVLPFSDFATPTKVSAPFCRVAGIIAPDIHFEVWLPPRSGWNGRLQGVGVGGMAGAINYPAMRAALLGQYATVGTDLGHAGNYLDGSFALGNPGKVVDWGYRAVHEMTVKAKAVVAAYYGEAPHFSYFTGCSGGGREGLMEAQRFPDDYDGILAGDPTADFTHLTEGGRLWVALALLKDPSRASYIPAAKIPVIAEAVNDECDALDGVADGIIADPRACHFNPAKLLCKQGDAADCLTAPQVDALRKIYDGSRTSTGARIFPGYEPGGELGPAGWASYVSGAEPFKGSHWAYAGAFVKYLVFENLNYDPLTFDFDRDIKRTDEKPILNATLAKVINATNPDLRAFQARGGKLIHYHGWSDPGVAPLSSVNYYESVVGVEKSLAKTRDFYRLFMVPGMQHCVGGPGATNFMGVPATASGAPEAGEHDILNALTGWVEKHTPPDRVIATKFVDDSPAKGVKLTRPLCPYPETARWNGAGSTDQAANFTCVAPGK